MAFGISFGSKKNTAITDSTIKKDTTLTGSQDTAKVGSTEQFQSTNQSGTSTTSGATSQTGTQNQSTTGTETGRQTGTTTTLGADVQQALSDRVQAILSSGLTDSNLTSLSNQIAGRTSFDPNAAVAAITGQARNRGEQTLQEQNSAYAARVGGTPDTNSMAALLAQRGRNDLEANVAGVEADARMKMEGVANQNLSTAAGASGAMADFATQLGGLLKGGTTTTDMSTLSNQIQQLLGNTTQTGTNTESSANQQNQTSQMSQLLQELANVLTNQKESTVGTENSKTTNKQSGGGFSLGF